MTEVYGHCYGGRGRQLLIWDDIDKNVRTN